MIRRLALSALLGAAMLGSPADSLAGRASMSVFPRMMLWAWERPEDLRGLGADTGVAFLAQTLLVDGPRIEVLPRRQPLRVDPATPLMAVTRIEHPSNAQPPDDLAITELVGHIARSRALPRVRGVQIDYDEAASERQFYRALLLAVRRDLGRSTPLSMTALASWCVGDRWLDELPVDEAVPMLFRMGPFNEPYRALASSRGGGNACGEALGVSLDEPLPFDRAGRRVYLFNNRAWDRETIGTTVREID